MRAQLLFHRALVFAVLLPAQHPAPELKPELKKALQSIRPSELKGDLSFLASDALLGRYTPSPGLEIAAEFIASKFRAVGLEPGGANDYFQPAQMVERTLPKVTTPLIGNVICKAGEAGKPITVEPDKIHVTKISTAARFTHVSVLKVSERNPEKLKGLDLEGKVILVPMPDFADIPAKDRTTVYEQIQKFDQALAASKAVLQVVVVKALRPIPPSRFLFADEALAPAPPIVQVESPELAAALQTQDSLALSLEIPAPHDEGASVKNVIGVLRGSDPALKSTCVMLTAHYDHIGTTDNGAGLASPQSSHTDKIFNGANDDGSGTVSVIEIARALSQLHPRRSIVFVAFFGEERGLLGSTYYGRHPLFPISQTVADINLEQVGRTDSNEGPQIASASITGYDYSNVTKYLENAGLATGIKIYKDDAGSDEYFVRSDNAALARQGVPAHTLTTAFEYPDYHAVGDEWQKIDYDNMAKVDRAVALAILNIANTAKAPQWNEENSRTQPFREAQKRQHEMK